METTTELDTISEPAVQVKQELLSRENTPFLKSSSLPPQSRLSTPIPSPVAAPGDLPCSQETTTDTVSTLPVTETPIKPKIEEDTTTPSPLLQDSPSNLTSSARRKKRKTRRGKPIQSDNATSQPPPMRLTHANKQWFDVLHTKQSGQSVSTVGTEHRPAPRIREGFNYAQEILSRSLGWILLPLKWGAHWAALYLLPLAIALGFLAIVAYIIFPRYIFSAIPTIFTTTTSILAFPARLVVTHTPDAWCNYVGLGCTRNDTEGEEVVRNATFATDLEVRNAFTVIHNLNYLNNSSNRLVLDSVLLPHDKN